ncbi:antitoxin Xre/MbcA/ParS toxin-binding domain-containing protein [Phenylobacterium sp.]|uniref:antitoxin Xre/MbcA/ParS toxin-binding domain-containing protein n=1 Tax=Phenylobacterium sp. TaxID=1871053 RepID=UPI0034577946
MSREQGGGARTFAETLSRATPIFGAEYWLERPALGLDQRKPIDLMATPAGVETGRGPPDPA